MELADARSLSPQTQQALRQRAVAAVVEQGRTQQQVARELGVARATVKRWVQRDRARGEPALAARKQGRPPHPNWERAQLAQLTQLIRDYAPEQLQLPYPLWTLAVWAAAIPAGGEQLPARLGAIAAKAGQASSGAVPALPFEAGWSTSTQPCSGRVSGRAPKFTLGDEMGLRSDHQTGTCWVPKGQTPVVKTTGSALVATSSRR